MEKSKKRAWGKDPGLCEDRGDPAKRTKRVGEYHIPWKDLAKAASKDAMFP